MVLGQYTDAGKSAVYVHLNMTWNELQKVRIVCNNQFNGREGLVFTSLANGGSDPESYCVIAKRRTGRKITKRQIENAMLAVEIVLATVKSY